MTQSYIPFSTPYMNGFTATATSLLTKRVEIYFDKELEMLLEQWKESSAGKLLDSLITRQDLQLFVKNAGR